MLLLARKLFEHISILFMGIWAMLKLNMAVTMFLSMGVSALFYAVSYGIWYAAGICALLFVHEVGHIIAARAVGIRGSLPIFIPFLGAMVKLHRLPINCKMAANIAIGGPALGTLGALFCVVLYFWSDHVLMLVMAYMGCVLNLFNLIPCEPLDGGKIAEAISPYLWWVGSMIIIGMFFYTHNVLIFLIFLFSLRQFWGIRANQLSAYYKISGGQRLKVLSWYLGLILVLGLTTLYLGTLLW